MTFGGLIESLGEKLGVEIEDAGGAFALEANYLYSGTGGATLAVNPADGHLHLQKYNWLGRLDCDKSLDMLTRFAETAALWRRLRGEAPGEGTSRESAQPYAGQAGFMPV